MSSSGTPHPLPVGERVPDPDAYPGVLEIEHGLQVRTHLVN
ncbi:hypothetical protein [Streptomyces sp. NBC_00203]